MMRLLVLLAGAGAVSAQLLTKGNTQLPSCAQSCPALNQAVNACSGTGAVSLGTWSCFCQSAYLRTLYQSATGVCDSTCTNPSDLQQVSTWYNTECGTDFGQSQHASSAEGNAQSSAAGNTQSSATSSAANTATTAAQANPPTTTSSGGYVATTNQSESGSWWSNHWKWIVMLIALLVGLLIFAAILTWLKRRSDRKRDNAPLGFNPGITNRPVPTIHTDTSFLQEPARPSNAGRDSAARTREAVMPYGYGYTRSQSRVGSQTNVSRYGGRETPQHRSDTPIRDAEKGVIDEDAIQPVRQNNGLQSTSRVRIREQGLNEKR